MEGLKRIRGQRARGRAAGFTCALLGLVLAAAPLPGQDTAVAPALPQSDPDLPRLPSEKTAFKLSLYGSLAPFGLSALMAIVQQSDMDWGSPGLDIAALVMLCSGSSAGFLYGGCWGRGLLMAGLRLGATAALIAYTLNWDERDNTVLVLTYLGGMAGSIVFDLATVKKAVRKHNQARLAKRGLSVALSPIALPKGAGVQLRMSF
jgi:hypothetical protein